MLPLSFRAVLNPPPPPRRPTVSPPPAPPPAPASGKARIRLEIAAWLPRRRGWVWALLLLPVAPGVGVFSFYALWAGSFDLKKLGEMPQRAVVFDMDGNFATATCAWARTASRAAGQGVARFPPRARRPRGHPFLPAPRRRSPRHRARHRAQHHPPPRRRGRQHAHPATRAQQPAAGRQDAQRKILEAFVAVRIERHYTKQQILELYVNRIFYGGSLYGIETASQAYFGKPSAQLDLSESRHDGRADPQPQPLFAADQPRGRGPRTRHRARAHGRIGHDHPAQEQQAEHEQIKVARNRPRRRAGKLRDGRRAQRAFRPAHRRADRRGRPEDLHHHRPPVADARHAGRRAATRQNREPPRLRSSEERARTPARTRAPARITSRARWWSSTTATGPCAPSSAGASTRTRGSTAPRTCPAARSARRSSPSSTRRLAKGPPARREHRRRPHPPRRTPRRAELAPRQFRRHVRPRAGGGDRPHPFAQHDERARGRTGRPAGRARKDRAGGRPEQRTCPTSRRFSWAPSTPPSPG